MHSIVGVHAHSCGLYQASAHSVAEPLTTTTTQDLDIQTQIEFLIQKPILLFSN